MYLMNFNQTNGTKKNNQPNPDCSKKSGIQKNLRHDPSKNLKIWEVSGFAYTQDLKNY